MLLLIGITYITISNVGGVESQALNIAKRYITMRSMEFIILGLLFFKDMTIYEMNSHFKETLSLIYAASYGSLQNATKKQLKADLISVRPIVERGRSKKVYSITPSGREAFFQWMEEPINPSKLEVSMLSKMFFLGLVPSIEKRKMIVKTMIEAAESVKEELESRKAGLKDLELTSEEMDIARFQFKTLDYGILAHRTGLEWLKQVYGELVRSGKSF